MTISYVTHVYVHTLYIYWSYISHQLFFIHESYDCLWDHTYVYYRQDLTTEHMCIRSENIASFKNRRFVQKMHFRFKSRRRIIKSVTLKNILD
jgi:hypothetical protein